MCICKLLLSECVHFSCCSPIASASASAAAPRLHLLVITHMRHSTTFSKYTITSLVPPHKHPTSVTPEHINNEEYACASLPRASARASYVGTSEVRMTRVTFAVGRPRTRRSCLVLVVSEPQWPHGAIVPSLYLRRQRMLSSAHLSELSISESVRLSYAHNYGLYHMACNNIPCDIPECDPPRTYIHT